ncbi:MAG: HupE/UreJ family protein [Candidatus Binatia bacterium]
MHRQTFACAGTFQGDVAIRYPIFNPAVTTLIRLVRQSGEQYTAVLGPHENTWTIPAPEARDGVVREYLGLGIRHILEGYDHLLFLGCLIFIAQTWRRILFAVTGFTVAHSLTLVLAALQLVHLPIPPVEAVIALSIVFLAREICLNRHDTLTVRYPIAVSSTFGLLHGFGFAAVLREIGLPQTELPFALLFFNLGVEIGQLLFIGTLIGLWLALRLVSHRVNGLTTETLLHHLRLPVGYVCGVVSSYWFLTRFARF